MKLKAILFLIVTTLLFASAKAQNAKKHFKEINKAEVVYLDDTVFSKGNPYCLMQEVKTQQSKPDFRISNLTGTLLMEAKFIFPDKTSSTGYYHLLFKKTNNLINTQIREGTGLPGLLVKNNLVRDGVVPVSQEQQMLNLFTKENEIIYADGTAYKDGRPCFKMKEITVSQYHPDYSIRNLSDEELIKVKYTSSVGGLEIGGTYYLVFPSGNTLRLKTNVEKNVAVTVAKSDLISNGQVIKEAEEKFILSNGGFLSDSSENKFTRVSRNINGEVIVLFDNITQDRILIGNIKTGEPFYFNKILYHEVSIYLPNGQKIAEAVFTANDADGRECKISTVKDQQKSIINLDRSKNETKQVAEFLISRGYL